MQSLAVALVRAFALPLLFSVTLGALAAAQTTFSEVHPIFVARCSQCHSVVGFGGFDIASPNISAAYFDSQQPSYWAPGQTKGYAAYQRILNGSMPPNAGCTGNPVLDAGQPACTTAAEQGLLGAWIADGQLGPASVAGVNPEFDVRVLVQTGTAIAFINEVGLDDSGTVVLRGADGQGSGLFRTSAAGQLDRITPLGSALYEGLAVRSGLPSFALTRRRVGSQFTLERWPVAGGAPAVLAYAPGDFTTLSTAFDVAGDGRVAFWAQNGSTQQLLVGYGPPFALVYSSPAGSASSQTPALAEDGRVVFRDNAGAVLRADAAGGATVVLAGSGMGLTLSPFPPQVSRDGELALFGGDRGQGPGLIAWSSFAQPSSFLHFAGERLEGLDAGASVTLRDARSVTDPAGASTLRAVIATTAGGATGFYATSQRLRRDSDGAPYLSGGRLRKLVGAGDTLGSSVVAAVNTQARFNGAGALVCTVALAGGPLAVVRATPRESADGPVRRVRVNVVRVSRTNRPTRTLWSEAQFRRALAHVNTAFEREILAGLQFELVAAPLDLQDPGATLGTVSWFDVDPTQLGAIELAARATPSVSGWRNDALNLYLVNSLGSAPAASSYPPGHPCAGSTEELVLLAAPAPGATVESLARVLAQQLCRYFGLAPTFETGCAGPDVFTDCGFPFQNAAWTPAGDRLRDTPFDPDTNGVGDTLALDAFYAACPPARALVRRNLMSNYAGDPLRLRLSAGQLQSMHATADGARAHVMAP